MLFLVDGDLLKLTRFDADLIGQLKIDDIHAKITACPCNVRHCKPVQTQREIFGFSSDAYYNNYDWSSVFDHWGSGGGLLSTSNSVRVIAAAASIGRMRANGRRGKPGSRQRLKA